MNYALFFLCNKRHWKTGKRKVRQKRRSPKDKHYISLTDIAKVRDSENPSQIISLWMRTYSTIEYLGLWEKLNNPNFKPHIYEGFKNESAKPQIPPDRDRETP